MRRLRITINLLDIKVLLYLGKTDKNLDLHVRIPCIKKGFSSPGKKPTKTTKSYQYKTPRMATMKKRQRMGADGERDLSNSNPVEVYNPIQN